MNSQEVDTSSPEVLIADARSAAQSALYAIDHEDLGTASWALDKLEEKLEELADHFENAQA